MSAEQHKQSAQRAAHDFHDQAVALSHDLAEHPELAFEETRSAAAVSEALEAHGFTVERGIADLETAFVATAGSGELVIAICAEYDALPGIGHACGHNVISASAVTAGIALADIADDLDITVRVYGTPAEELGGGKVLMLERGAFDGVHAAMMVHPSPEEYADHYARANQDIDVTYTGKPAHAAAAPTEGINALDAMTVAQVAIGLLRQQLPDSAIVSGFVLEAGTAANIIPGRSSMRYDIRASTLAELAVIEKRVLACFEAGAVATGCRLEVEKHSRAYSEFRNDDPMVAAYRANAEQLGRVFDEELPPSQRMALAGSTDMANVSLLMPTIHPMVRVETRGAVNHQPEFAQCCVEESADRTILEAGTAMAWTMIDLATDPQQRRRLLDGSTGHAATLAEQAR